MGGPKRLEDVYSDAVLRKAEKLIANGQVQQSPLDPNVYVVQGSNNALYEVEVTPGRDWEGLTIEFVDGDT